MFPIKAMGVIVAGLQLAGSAVASLEAAKRTGAALTSVMGVPPRVPSVPTGFIGFATPPASFPGTSAFPATSGAHSRHGGQEYRNRTHADGSSAAGNLTAHCNDLPGHNHTLAEAEGGANLPANETHHRLVSQYHDHSHNAAYNHTLLDLGGTGKHNRTDLLGPSSTGGGVLSTITPAPDVTVAINQKFRQTTYYTCITIGPNSHCGWHKPILDASLSDNESAGVSVYANCWLIGLLSLLVCITAI